MRNLPAKDDLLNDFVKYAADKGVPARWHYIHQSQDIITSVIKALIAAGRRDLIGSGKNCLVTPMPGQAVKPQQKAKKNKFSRYSRKKK